MLSRQAALRLLLLHAVSLVGCDKVPVTVFFANNGQGTISLHWGKDTVGSRDISAEKWAEDIPTGGTAGQASYAGTVWTSRWSGCEDPLHHWILKPEHDQTWLQAATPADGSPSDCYLAQVSSARSAPIQFVIYNDMPLQPGHHIIIRHLSSIGPQTRHPPSLFCACLIMPLY